MSALQLSYHSISVFTPALLCTLMALFLLLKPNKSRATWWLAATFAGFCFMFWGYFVAYSVLHPLGSFHRWMTVVVLFGLAALVTFGYLYPRNDRPKEARVMITVMWLVAVFGWGRFAYLSLGLEPYYDFTAHFYSVHLGAVTAIFILFGNVWAAALFWRKTVRYSAEADQNRWAERPAKLLSPALLRFLAVRFVMGPVYIVRPRGRDATACRGFFVALFMQIFIGVLNVANKNGALGYELYAFLYGVISLIAVFTMFMVYINNSPEPTTFMVKLVGISLFTLLLVLGLLSDYALTLNEASYNRERASEVANSRQEIRSGDFAALPESIVYVLRRPEGPGLFHDGYEILWARDGAIDRGQLRAGEERMRANWLRARFDRLKRGRTAEAARSLAAEQAGAEWVPKIEHDPSGHVNAAGARSYRDAGEYFTHFDFVAEGFRYEVGFRYGHYRAFVHRIASNFLYLLVGTALVIVLVFPLFFRSSLVNPLNWLLDGVKQVNQGDLSVAVPIKDPDEIGFLAKSFNSMVVSIKEAHVKLEDYAHNLEEKVEERTREVREKMEEVHRLKVQQDGDYFLTSLLAAPLFYNANKSGYVSTQFLIEQKKRFEFRNRQGELGGDICVSGNLRLGRRGNHRRYSVAVNGDAMGKSMQGAGGALVMGVMMNSIMARSAARDRVLEATPEDWLTDVYNELHGVFRSFDGSMVISATIFVIDELSGEAWYFNAEHPHTVLYRNGRASFIEEELLLRKLGLDSEFPFRVFKVQLEPGDVLIIGSDGKDDINLTPDQPVRTINEDEYLFLGFVEQAKGDLERATELVRAAGGITDDLSLLRIGFQEAEVPDRLTIQQGLTVGQAIDIDRYETEEFYQHARKLYQAGDLKQALAVLQDGYSIDHSNMKLNKLLGLLSFKGQDYERAVEVLNRYIEADPELPTSLLYLSLAEKKLGHYQDAIAAGLRLHELDPHSVRNLLNLADLYRLSGDHARMAEFLEAVARIEPENTSLAKLRSLVR